METPNLRTVCETAKSISGALHDIQFLAQAGSVDGARLAFRSAQNLMDSLALALGKDWDASPVKDVFEDPDANLEAATAAEDAAHRRNRPPHGVNANGSDY